MGSKDTERRGTGEGEPVEVLLLENILADGKRTEHLESIPLGLNDSANLFAIPMIRETGYTSDSRFGRFVFLIASANSLSTHIVREIRTHTIGSGARTELSADGKIIVGDLRALQTDIHATRRELGMKIFGDKETVDKYTTMVDSTLLRFSGAARNGRDEVRNKRYQALGEDIRNNFPLTSR